MGLIQNKVDRQGHFSCERDCCEVTSQAANIVEELNYTQEEADTRLILHAAKSGYKAVAVASEDTEVFLLCWRLIALFGIRVCKVWSTDKN